MVGPKALPPPLETCGSMLRSSPVVRLLSVPPYFWLGGAVGLGPAAAVVGAALVTPVAAGGAVGGGFPAAHPASPRLTTPSAPPRRTPRRENVRANRKLIS